MAEFIEKICDIEERRIYLFGEIDTLPSKNIIRALFFLDKTDGVIEIIINSPGGIVSDGWAIIDVIHNMKSEVHGIVYGDCSSMASMVLQAADWRKMSKNSSMVIHQGTVALEGELSEVLSRASQVKKELSNSLNLYANRSGLNVKKIKEIMTTNQAIDAKTALKLGLIDELI